MNDAAPPPDPELDPCAPPRDAAAARWSEVRALFDAVLALPAPARADHLAALRVEPEVRAELLSLLAHAGDGTDTPDFARPALAQALAPAGALTIGQRLGPWAIDHLLGQGGMGEVYQARRADGAYEGMAAVKVLKRGMDSAAVLSRFASERRALARLQHPNIAQLYDAGLTDGGVPYFVMEWVDGRPIDTAVQGEPLERRLALFLQLTQAVAHAHRQLLVHRDLKPGNVLVDAQGRVKLLDFGIAKALDPNEGATAEHTALDQRPFTPSFASPEQVRGEPVGTATDIYSLGVLLYVLLTGQRPYGRAARTPAEVARAVLEEDATRPSALTSAQADWPLLRKRLSGDLDNILLKTLAKPPELRYASVDALAADVQAHLTGYPVLARPPRAGYLVSRFVRRNRTAVAAAAVAGCAVLAGAGAALWQARVADAQRDVAQQRFKQVRQLANQLVFKYHDQIEHLPGAAKAREALLVDAAAFLDNLDQAATDDPQLAFELASTHYRIARLQGVNQSMNTGQHDEAEANLDKALALSTRYVDRPEMSTAALGVAINMRVSKAERWQRRGYMAEADAALVPGLKLLEQALARDPHDSYALASAISLHGVHARILGSNLEHASLGRWREACESADRARQAAETTLAADPINVYVPDSVAFTLDEQAHCRLLGGRWDEAAALAQQQVQLRDQMATRFPDDQDFRFKRAISRGQLARAMSLQGRHAQARETVNLALDLARQAVAADPGNQAGPLRLDALSLISVELHIAAGDLAAARLQALAVLQGIPTPMGPGFAPARRRAEALLWAARTTRAVDARRALAHAQEAASLLGPAREGDDNATRRVLLAQAQGEQALAWQQIGDHGAAQQAARASLASWAAGAAPDTLPPLLQPWLAPVRAVLR